MNAHHATTNNFPPPVEASRGVSADAGGGATTSHENAPGKQRISPAEAAQRAKAGKSAPDATSFAPSDFDSDQGAAAVNIFGALDDDAAKATGANACTGYDEYRYDDLVEYVTPPDHMIAGNGVIRRMAGCLFAGGTGLGKTVAVMCMSVWLAAGKKLFGCVNVPDPVKVLYFGAENDPDTLKRDILSAVKHSGADPRLVQHNLVISHCWGRQGEAFIQHFTEMQEKHKPDVVIIDPYQSFVDPADLNGSHAFLAWIIPIQKMMHRHNFGLILVAHTPKPAQHENWNHRERVYLAAGSSVISNWARTSMELTPAGQEMDRFLLTFGKNGERAGLTDESGHILRHLFLQHSGNIHEPYWTVADNQGTPSKSKYAEKIMQLAADHPSMSYAEIAEQVGCSKSLVFTHYPKKKN